ncbi:MAG: hypothetical protein GX577_02685 [Leptolinea sp.]|nr:hypothetical protein [Leptolinea sp.]NMA12294.1 hypothetical protein [Chloroflexota bacterium]
MSQFFESLMLICFGISWPLSIMKSWKSRTSKGKSAIFLVFILIGYVSGIIAKIISGNVTYVVFFYALNFVLVATDLVLYFRNDRLDKMR